MQRVQKIQRNTHNRTKSHSFKNQHFRVHALHHNQYMKMLKKNINIFPRYDVLSQNNHNNLIVHVRRQSKQDLKPHKTSVFLSKLQQKIQQAKQQYKTSKSKSAFNINRYTNRSSFKQQAKSQLNLQQIAPQHILNSYSKLINYQQQQDRAMTMQEKLKIMYQGHAKAYYGHRSKIVAQRLKY